MGNLTDRLSASGLGRALFGSVLAFMAFDNFRDLEGSIGYADSKGVPEPETLVPFSSGMLLFGGLGIALGRFKRLAPGAVVSWFVAVTPQMHDFWNMEDDQREGQQIHFLKNLIILGGAFYFLANENED